MHELQHVENVSLLFSYRYLSVEWRPQRPRCFHLMF